MVKIQSSEEFSSIRKTDFGYIVEEKNGSHTLHKTKCNSLSVENFIDTSDPDSGTKFHWFSTIALVEKSFPDTITCTNCKPS
jgi:hypothetical protein